MLTSCTRMKSFWICRQRHVRWREKTSTSSSYRFYRLNEFVSLSSKNFCSVRSLVVSLLGNGRAFYQEHHQRFMFIYMLFIISSLKQSKAILTGFRSYRVPWFLSRMYGMFQTVFYFGYMALFSLGLGIMCGTFGYIGTQVFVRKIYSIKID